mmetsp:Transcript_32669/g.70565  ORF Transcript_32669/g.70565 Transcript_32669/m.70565 type:complete len:321 (-) Transcript_32669:98-1060(-)
MGRSCSGRRASRRGSSRRAPRLCGRPRWWDRPWCPALRTASSRWWTWTRAARRKLLAGTWRPFPSGRVRSDQVRERLQGHEGGGLVSRRRRQAGVGALGTRPGPHGRRGGRGQGRDGLSRRERQGMGSEDGQVLGHLAGPRPAGDVPGRPERRHDRLGLGRQEHQDLEPGDSRVPESHRVGARDFRHRRAQSSGQPRRLHGLGRHGQAVGPRHGQAERDDGPPQGQDHQGQGQRRLRVRGRIGLQGRGLLLWRQGRGVGLQGLQDRLGEGRERIRVLRWGRRGGEDCDPRTLLRGVPEHGRLTIFRDRRRGLGFAVITNW